MADPAEKNSSVETTVRGAGGASTPETVAVSPFLFGARVVGVELIPRTSTFRVTVSGRPADSDAAPETTTVAFNAGENVLQEYGLELGAAVDTKVLKLLLAESEEPETPAPPAEQPPAESGAPTPPAPATVPSGDGGRHKNDNNGLPGPPIPPEDPEDPGAKSGKGGSLSAAVAGAFAGLAIGGPIGAFFGAIFGGIIDVFSSGSGDGEKTAADSDGEDTLAGGSKDDTLADTSRPPDDGTRGGQSPNVAPKNPALNRAPVGSNYSNWSQNLSSAKPEPSPTFSGPYRSTFEAKLDAVAARQREDSRSGGGGNGNDGNRSSSNSRANTDRAGGTHPGRPGGEANPHGLPIVLDLDGDGLEFVSLEESTALFDMDGDGYFEKTGWVGPDDGFLIVDLDGDGTVSSTNELIIANQTPDETDTDLQALGTLYDDDNNGVINSLDRVWNNLRVWRDLNQNGQSDPGEMQTMEEVGIDRIGLTRNELPEDQQDRAGNTLFATAQYRRPNGSTGLIGDAALNARAAGHRFVDNGDGVELQFEGAEGAILFAKPGVAISVDAFKAGHTAVMGGDDDDTVMSSASAGDTAEGGGRLVAEGGGGVDVLIGGAGADVLNGGAGADYISGGGGHDVVLFDADDTARGLVSGGAGYDIGIVASSQGVTLNAFDAGFEALFGNSGADSFTAGGSADSPHSVIFDGRSGDDKLTGGAGNDVLSGGEGADTVNGGGGDDTLILDDEDTFDGGEGVDTAYYTSKKDLTVNISDHNVEIFHSGAGDDVLSTNNERAAALYGRGGDDALNGGWGGDFLSGGGGADTLKGGLGSDTYYFGVGDGRDTVSDTYTHTGTIRGHTKSEELDAGAEDSVLFGSGVAVTDLIFRRSGAALQIALRNDEAAADPAASFDDLPDWIEIQDWENAKRKIETLRFFDGTEISLAALARDYGLGAGDGSVLDLGAAMAVLAADAETGDVTAGTGEDDTIGGADGEDHILGQGGDDVLFGSAGADVMDGGAGTDTADYSFAYSGVRVDLAQQDADPDNADAKYDFGAGDGFIDVEDVKGSVFDDTISGTDGANTLSGGAGADKLRGRGGADTLNGGDGDDVLEGGAGADTLNGGGGHDTASYADAAAGVTASLDGPSANTGDAEGDTYDGVEGLSGSAFDDNLTGDDNANTLAGGGGNDTLAGQGGADVYDFGRSGGQDTIHDISSATETRTRQEAYTYTTTYTRQVSSNGEGGYPPGSYTVRYGADGEHSARYQRYTVTRTAYRDVNYQVEVEADGGDDTLRLGESILPEHVLIRLAGDDLQVALKETEDSDTAFDDLTDRIVISNWRNKFETVETLEFADGTRLDLAALVEEFGVTDGGAPVDLGEAMAALSDADAEGGGRVLTGTSGDDVINGGDGDDVLSGMAGDDVLNGGAGDDDLNGGAGNDTLTGGAGADRIDGGDGFDTADYSGSAEGVAVDLAAGTVSGGDAEGDTLTGIEAVTGSAAGDNALKGNSEANTMNGGGGDDVIEGRGGADTLDGGGGTDTLSYKDSAAGVTVDLGAETAAGGDAEGDTISGFENISGSAHADQLTGDEADNIIEGGAGADTLDGKAGNDRLEGGLGDDVYKFGRGGGVDVIDEKSQTSAESGIRSDSDTLLFGADIDPDDLVVERFGDDVVVALADSNRPGAPALALSDRVTLKDWFSADKRIEAFQFADGQRWETRDIAGSLTTNKDNVLTWTETEFITDGLTGDDTLTGGAFDDEISGGEGDDVIKGGVGADMLDGGDGADTLSYEGSAAGVTVDLAAGTASGGDAEGDTIAGFENITGSVHADQFTGSDDDNIIEGGAGADTLDGGGGTDTLSYENSAKRVVVNLGAGTAAGGDAKGDTFTGFENTVGSAHNDRLTGDDGANTLQGGGGDVLNGGDGDDVLRLGKGSDIVSLGVGDGHDVIKQDGSFDAATTDVLSLRDSISKAGIWLSQQNDNLVIDLLGSDDSVKIEGYYAEGRIDAERLDQIEAAGEVLSLKHADITPLVSAMAAWSVRNSGQDGSGLTAMPQDDSVLTSALASAWQAG